MLTVTQCRKILGNMANDWSDETVLEVRDWLSTLAELILQVDQKHKKMKKNSNDRNEPTGTTSGQGRSRNDENMAIPRYRAPEVGTGWGAWK